MSEIMYHGQVAKFISLTPGKSRGSLQADHRSKKPIYRGAGSYPGYTRIIARCGCHFNQTVDIRLDRVEVVS